MAIVQKAIALILFTVLGTKSYAIVDDIRVFYYGNPVTLGNLLTFQKGDAVLKMNYDHVLGDSAKFQYINSYSDNGYYYFLFFATSAYKPLAFWEGGRTGGGFFAAGTIKTAFIVKISEDFTRYEVINEYLSNYSPGEYYRDMYIFSKYGSVFYFLMEGSSENDENDKYPKRISVDAHNLEKGFILIDHQAYDLIRDQQRQDLSKDKNYIFYDGY